MRIILHRFNKSGWRLLLPLFLLAAIFMVPAVQAQSDNDEVEGPAGFSMTIRGGFDGFYKRSEWVPITIELSNDGPAIEGVLRITVGRDGDTQVVYDSSVSLPTQSEKRIATFVYFPEFTTNLTVRLLAGNDVVASSRLTGISQIGPEDMLYGVLSEEPGELEFLERVVGDRSSAEVAFLELADLPDAASGWSALDILVLNDVDTGRMNEGQRSAIESWINSGGQLVVTGGSNWQQNSAGVADLLPVRLNGSQSVDALPELVEQFGFPYRDAGPYVVTTSTLQGGEVIYADAGIPMLARRQIGRGHVYFLAVDPKTAPLRDWDGNELLWAEIAATSTQLPFWATGVKESFLIRDAVRNLSALALPSAWLMLCFLSIYVLAIGPVNYFVLKRMGRRELAWFTIPATIVLFSLTTILIGFRTKGNEVIVNQLSIAYGQIDGDQARVESTVGLYSPRRAVYDLSFPADSLVRPLQDDFGTIGSGNIGSIERGNKVTVTDVRVDVSATETFVINSFQPLPDFGGEVTLRVDESGANLEIVVTNNSDLTIENAVIIFGFEVIPLGDLEPGQTETVNTTLNERLNVPTTDALSYSGYGTNSPLTATRNEVAIYGQSSNYGTFDDSAIQSRYQLIQALHGNSYSGEPTAMPQGVVTLMGWSSEPQVEMEIDARDSSVIATTLYFIELPLNRSISVVDDIEISQGLWNIEILDYQGIYNPSPFDLDLTNGSVQFEFTPWSDFQNLDVTGLDIVMSLPLGDYYQNQNLPAVSLWNWQNLEWTRLTDVVWGENRISEYQPFVSSSGSVRILLNNNSFESIQIREIQPILRGDLSS